MTIDWKDMASDPTTSGERAAEMKPSGSISLYLYAVRNGLLFMVLGGLTALGLAVLLGEPASARIQVTPEMTRPSFERFADGHGAQGLLQHVADTDLRPGTAATAGFAGHAIFLISVIMAAALVIIFLLVRRNRASMAALQALAKEQFERGEELERSRAQLQEGLGRLSAVLDNVADAIITIDDQGVIESANPATERIFGHSVESLIGRNVAVLMPEAIARQHDVHIGSYLEKGESRIIGVGRQVQGLRSDGSVFPVEVSIGELTVDGRRIFTGILRDITERHRAETALRASEQRARALSMVAARTDNAVIITNAEGRINWVNDGFERISGYTLEEIEGHRPGALLQGEKTDPQEVSRIRTLIAAGRGFNTELLNYTKNGTPYWVQIDAQPVLRPDGSIEYFIAIERDVTETKQRESELREARHRAEEGNRAKSRFLAMMSHEIRTPLNGVLGALSLLEDEPLTAEQKNFVTVGTTAAENLLTIINDILDVSKMEAGRLDLEPSITELQPLTDDVVSVLSGRAAEKGIAMVAEHDPSLPSHIVTDSARVRQILINLVGNAVKFTDDGGVSVRVDKVGETEDRVMVRFEVVDTGIGIDASDQEHLFTEFWAGSAPDRVKMMGTGLGLAICKRLVDMLDGRIGVISNRGHGTTFWVELPFAIPEPEALAELNSNGSSRDGETTTERRFDNRILVAEDNSANQLIIKAMLERMGLQVDVVGDGREAVDAVSARPYDLVLMDINMPVMDGIAATHMVRGMPNPTGQIPVVAMTAHVMRGDRDKILSEGLDDYIPKPVNRKDLVVLLNRWLAETSNAPLPEHPQLVTAPSPTGTFEQEDAIDVEALEELREASGTDLVLEIIDLFEAECEKRVGAITEGAASGDFDTVRANAHALKSSAASLGAYRLSELCESAEKGLGLAGNLVELVDAIDVAAREAIDELSKWS